MSNQFIRFVDKTPRRVLQDSIMLMSEYEQAQKEVMEKESDTDIRLNLLIDATPDATMKIIMAIPIGWLLADAVGIYSFYIWSVQAIV